MPQIQEAKRTPSMINTKKSIPRQIIFKLQKNQGQRKLESMLREWEKRNHTCGRTRI